MREKGRIVKDKDGWEKDGEWEKKDRWEKDGIVNSPAAENVSLSIIFSV